MCLNMCLQARSAEQASERAAIDAIKSAQRGASASAGTRRSAAGRPDAVSEPTTTWEPAVGDVVFVAKLGAEARVSTVAKGHVMVEVGPLSVKCKRSEIARVAP